MTSPRTFLPTHGVAVGQLIPRVRPLRGLLRLMAILLVVLVVLVAVTTTLSLVTGTATESNLPSFVASVVFFGAFTGNAYIASRPTEIVVLLSIDGIQSIAGKYSLAIPWDRVERLWVTRSGSICPILCVAVDGQYRFTPKGLRWRFKPYANRRLFGTPLATPLLSTGLNEPVLLDTARRYRVGQPQASQVEVELSPGEDPPRVPSDQRFHLRLAAGLTALAVAMIGAAWFGTLTLLQGDAVPGRPQDIPQTVVAVFWTVAASLMVAVLIIRIYHATVPFGDMAGRFREPVLRIGPDGIEHVVRGTMARVPWEAVRRVYLAGDHTGAGFVCVTTVDPYALVPTARGWETKAERNEQQYGAPVAAPLSGSGLAADDLLNAVRHYAGDRVLMG